MPSLPCKQRILLKIIQQVIKLLLINYWFFIRFQFDNLIEVNIQSVIRIIKHVHELVEIQFGILVPIATSNENSGLINVDLHAHIMHHFDHIFH